MENNDELKEEMVEETIEEDEEIATEEEEVVPEKPKTRTERNHNVEDDEFFDKKTKKDINEKSMFSKVMNIVLWIILFAWIAVVLVDFFTVKAGNEPKFCIKKETTTYEDGSVDSCLGLGYKVYNYKRDNFKAIEFGPFWSKDRSAEK